MVGRLLLLLVCCWFAAGYDCCQIGLKIELGVNTQLGVLLFSDTIKTKLCSSLRFWLDLGVCRIVGWDTGVIPDEIGLGVG